MLGLRLVWKNYGNIYQNFSCLQPSLISELNHYSVDIRWTYCINGLLFWYTALLFSVAIFGIAIQPHSIDLDELQYQTQPKDKSGPNNWPWCQVETLGTGPRSTMTTFNTYLPTLPIFTGVSGKSACKRGWTYANFAQKRVFSDLLGAFPGGAFPGAGLKSPGFVD